MRIKLVIFIISITLYVPIAVYAAMDDIEGKNQLLSVFKAGLLFGTNYSLSNFFHDWGHYTRAARVYAIVDNAKRFSNFENMDSACIRRKCQFAYCVKNPFTIKQELARDGKETFGFKIFHFLRSDQLSVQDQAHFFANRAACIALEDIYRTSYDSKQTLSALKFRAIGGAAAGLLTQPLFLAGAYNALIDSPILFALIAYCSLRIADQHLAHLLPSDNSYLVTDGDAARAYIAAAPVLQQIDERALRDALQGLDTASPSLIGSDVYAFSFPSEQKQYLLTVAKAIANNYVTMYPDRFMNTLPYSFLMSRGAELFSLSTAIALSMYCNGEPFDESSPSFLTIETLFYGSLLCLLYASPCMTAQGLAW